MVLSEGEDGGDGGFNRLRSTKSQGERALRALSRTPSDPTTLADAFIAGVRTQMCGEGTPLLHILAKILGVRVFVTMDNGESWSASLPIHTRINTKGNVVFVVEYENGAGPKFGVDICMCLRGFHWTPWKGAPQCVWCCFLNGFWL